MNKKNIILKVAFFVYIVFLVWLVVFKFNFSFADIRKVREINLLPFHYENVVEGDFPLVEALLNFIVFIPFGFFLEKLCKCKIWVKALVIASISLLFEVIQYLFSIGASDITDLITNTLGGLFGILIVVILRKIKK